MQIISIDKRVRKDTIQDVNHFTSQSLTKQKVSIMPAIKKTFDLMGYDIVELSTENETLKNKIDSYDEECSE